MTVRYYIKRDSFYYYYGGLSRGGVQLQQWVQLVTDALMFDTLGEAQTIVKSIEGQNPSCNIRVCSTDQYSGIEPESLSTPEEDYDRAMRGI